MQRARTAVYAAPVRVVSVHVGQPRPLGPSPSAIVKEPVPSAWLGCEGLEGDAQVDRRYHGGPERALLAYCADHYPWWREELALPGAGPGWFGENLAVEGLSEETARIGDVYGLGDARVQVSMPRFPCVKLERRLGRSGVVECALATRRTGFYLRVLQTGRVQPGPVQVVERSWPELTVARAIEALDSPERAEAFRSCPALSPHFRRALDGRR